MIYPCVAVALFALAAQAYIVPPAELPFATYHSWAHKHWVWNHNSYSNQVNVTALVDGYAEHDIPVGAVNIDSTWATEFNNFEVDTEKFPDFPALIASLHEQNIKVTLWATSMVNVENPDYDMCVEKNYFIRNGKGEVRPLGWWHGDGALLDYTNPEASDWWHSKMDAVLDVGVDGFKVDATDPYILEYILLSGAALTYDNSTISYREYANAYYRDFFYYTREKRGDGLIMSRPVDCAVDPKSAVCSPFSPYDVMYSGWVGDDDSTFEGLQGCLSKAMYSAWDGYANFGCDVGGYRSQDTGKDKEVFLRWAQAMAFLPLMENGGGGEHRPWMYDEETVDIYRNYVEQHYRLIPYLMTNGMRAMETNEISAIAPVQIRPDVFPARNVPITVFSYLLGDDILVHPVVEGGGKVSMTFPGADTWMNWFNPLDTLTSNSEQETMTATLELADSAVYVRRNAYLPLQASSKDEAVMWHWFGPLMGSEKEAEVRQPLDEGSGIISEIELTATGTMTGTITAHSGAGGFVVIGLSEPTSIDIIAADEVAYSTEYDAEALKLTVRVDDMSMGVMFHAYGVREVLVV